MKRPENIIFEDEDPEGKLIGTDTEDATFVDTGELPIIRDYNLRIQQHRNERSL
jgi:hypothetical protein